MEALRNLGASIAWRGQAGFLPVEIGSRGLAEGEVFVDASESSQFLSGILIAAPVARGTVKVRWSEKVASRPYLDMTIAMMKEVGIRFEHQGPAGIEIPAPQNYRSRNFTVEGDCSSASYFWGAAALTAGEVFTSPVSRASLQGDCRFLDVLEKMGCRILWEADGVRVGGPQKLSPVDIDMNEMPDMVPTLAVLCAFAGGVSHIKNVAHLRIKESDRLSAVAAGLRVLGIEARELADGLIIHGRVPAAAALRPCSEL